MATDQQPLDDAAIEQLRGALATGQRPALVVLTGGAGMPAGSRGQLARITDPAVEAEFVHVKIGNDELPFAPTELALAGRRRRAAKQEQAAPEPRTPTPASPEPATPEPATPEPATPEPATPEPAAEADVTDAPRKGRRPARTASAPPRLTLTLRFADLNWTIEALVAGRREKPQPVPLAAIRAFADQLDDQQLRRQIDAAVQACRGEAEKRAALLRAELARLETELAALDD